jgi:acetate kinase
MEFFKYDSKFYFNIRKFCFDYNLKYDSVRYHMRKYGSKENFMKYLNQNPDTIIALIDRYTIREVK